MIHLPSLAHSHFNPKWQNVMISNFCQLWVFGFGFGFRLSYHVPIHHNIYFYQFWKNMISAVGLGLGLGSDLIFGLGFD